MIALVCFFSIALSPNGGVTKPLPDFALEVTVTAYTSLPWLTDSTPFITATGTLTRIAYEKGKHWHVVALSRDLLAVFPYGSRVLLRCPDGVVIYGLVEDTMNARWRRRADIWFPSLRQAKQWGVKKCELSKY